jgi:putative acyl-CoA dehydrogenase
VQHTRLDCVLGSAGIMRAAVSRAVHHAQHRIAFGYTLAAQPLMRAVLADLALESEAATALGLRLARAYDAPPGSKDAAFARVATPAAKYWTCKRALAVTGEAMEALGGNGYVEENPLPRFYREAPVNSIWEGSGNVMCLDVLRALTRESDAVDALREELGAAKGGDRRYDAALAALDDALRSLSPDPGDARRIVQAIVLALQSALLIRHAPAFVADAFCASRLGTQTPFGGATFGTLPSGGDTAAIVARAAA